MELKYDMNSLIVATYIKINMQTKSIFKTIQYTEILWNILLLQILYKLTSLHFHFNTLFKDAREYLD